MKTGPADHHQPLRIQHSPGMSFERVKGEPPRLNSVVEIDPSRSRMGAFLHRLVERLRGASHRSGQAMPCPSQPVATSTGNAWLRPGRAFVCTIGATEVMHPDAWKAKDRKEVFVLDDLGPYVVVQPRSFPQERLYVRFWAPGDPDAPGADTNDGQEVSVIKLTGVAPDRERAFLQDLEKKKVLVEGLHRRLMDGGDAASRRET